MKLNTQASPRDCLLPQDSLFLSFSSKYRVKTSKHILADRRHQNKQCFEGKRLSEKEFIAFAELVWQTQPARRIARKDFFCFLTSIFAFFVFCYPPESFKTICFTCIWSKFIDTSFHLRKARNKVLAASTRFSQLIIAGLHVTSRRPRCISLLWELNSRSIFM